MPKKSKKVAKPAALRTGDPDTLAMLLRNGGGKHDTRPRGQRDRAGQRRAWQRDQGVAA